MLNKLWLLGSQEERRENRKQEMMYLLTVIRQNKKLPVTFSLNSLGVNKMPDASSSLTPATINPSPVPSVKLLWYPRVHLAS